MKKTERGPRKAAADLDPESLQLAVSLRTRIAAQADPIGFLTRVLSGEEIDGERATLTQRVEVACKLAAKIIPDLRGVELSGAGGEKLELGSGEAFNRIMGKLGKFAPARPTDETLQ